LELSKALSKELLKNRYKTFSAKNDTGIHGRLGECSNIHENCKHDSPVCHYVKPDQMLQLWKENQEAGITKNNL